MSVQCSAGCSCWGKPPLRTSQNQTSLCCLLCLCYCLPEGTSLHGIGPTAPCQLWPHGDSSTGGMGGALAPWLQAKTKPGVYSGMPHAMLQETWLVVAPDDCLSFPPCQIPPLPETVTWEWRFGVADSDPLSPGGNNLQAHLIINPSGMRPASRLCLPFPYLRCHDTHSTPSPSHCPSHWLS
jgi:hypothetical protein